MNNRNVYRLLAIPAMLFFGSLATAQTTPMGTGASATAPNTTAADNTKSNKEDPSNTAQTADSQPNNSTDMELTQRIRQSVMADKEISTYGHNVKIVTTNGKVTLNGVVRSDEEKAQIGAKAASVVGTAHVVNELKVAPTK